MITTEPQYPTSDAETLRREVGNKLEDQRKKPELAELDPLETATEEDLRDPAWYEHKMRQNIDNLVKASWQHQHTKRRGDQASRIAAVMGTSPKLIEHWTDRITGAKKPPPAPKRTTRKKPSPPRNKPRSSK